MFKYQVKNYSDEKIDVAFQVGSVSFAIMLVKKMEIAQHIQELDEGFIAAICYQEIPEIIRELSKQNIAIYTVTTVI